MNSLYSFSILIIATLFLSACDDSQDLSESLKAQSELTSQAQIEANTRNTQLRSIEMESDLERRQRFYQGVQGRYEGSFSTSQGDFNLRVMLTPTLAPFPFRDLRSFRQLEEVISDLNNLAFNIVIMQWSAHTNLSAISCTIENVRPDVSRGLININSAECTSSFTLYIASPDTTRATQASVARELSDLLLSEQINRVDTMVGEILPRSNPQVFNFKINKQDDL